jgi:DNA-directed RNA polymerase subunit K/omega
LGGKEDKREKSISYKERISVGPPRLTDFERAKIIGIRAIQVQMGAPLFIDPEGEKDPIKIAERELFSGTLPLSIKRSLPDSREYPSIPVNWLLEAEKEDLRVEL